MATNTQNSDEMPDKAIRFLFEDTDMRGEVVHLRTSLQHIFAVHQYPPGVSALLGEFAAAAVLLSTTLKFEGKLILQARSEGQIPLLMVECSNNREIRAIARGAEHATSTQFSELLASGQLAITIDPNQGKRYQGIVPLEGDSLAQSLDAYFQLSEQLQTKLWLGCDGQTAGGLLLQQLPAQLTNDAEQRQAQWEHACTLAATLQTEELTGLKPEQLLHRLFHEDTLRVFDPQPVEFSCTCSRERTYSALVTLGAAEVADILKEQGSVSMDCEFCNQQYIFYPDDLQDILANPAPPTVH